MIKDIMKDSLAFTIIYTIGHFLIAISCVVFITGAPLELATIDAMVEPLINAVWLFVLHKIYVKCYCNNEGEKV